jgi:hypothetical protein
VHVLAHARGMSLCACAVRMRALVSTIEWGREEHGRACPHSLFFLAILEHLPCSCTRATLAAAGYGPGYQGPPPESRSGPQHRIYQPDTYRADTGPRDAREAHPAHPAHPALQGRRLAALPRPAYQPCAVCTHARPCIRAYTRRRRRRRRHLRTEGSRRAGRRGGNRWRLCPAASAGGSESPAAAGAGAL